MTARLAAVASLCFAAVALSAAQDTRAPDSQQQPTFRTGTESVRVDLYVTRNGEPITDLRRDEIQILEDDKPQAILTFERIAFAAHTAAAPPDPKTLEETRRLSADPRSRLFVLFVPTPDVGYVLGPTAESRRLLVEPLNDLLGADDLIAVMTPYSRVGDLTFLRRVPVNDSVFVSAADIADPRHLLWDICYPPIRPGSPNAEMKARQLEAITLDALESLITHVGGMRDERKHILLVTDGFRLFTENPALRVQGGAPQSQPFPTGQGPQGLGIQPRLGDAGAITDDTFRECDKDLQALSSIDHRMRLDEVGELARRNNVSFTPISLARMQTQNASGRVTTRGTAVNTTPREMESSMRGLAERTGGTAIVNTNDIAGYLRGMMATTSAYYLLGYAPTNTALDGKFRRITVKVARPGVLVHARPGYTAGTPAETRTAERLDTAARNPLDTAFGALAASSASRPLRISASAWTRNESAGQPVGAIWIAGELESTSRPATATTASAVAQLTMQAPGGARTISRRVEFPANATSFAFDLADEKLTPGAYVIRVSVTRPDGAQLSDVAQANVAGSSSPLGEPVLFRRGPSTAQRYVRTAVAQFQRSDRLRLELPSTAADAPTATLRDSKGGTLPVPVTLTERKDESGAWRWIVADITLAPLAPAAYAVEVTQGGASRATAFRVIP